jgi:hypothetical protein
VPFLDKDFMTVAMAIDPAEKMVQSLYSDSWGFRLEKMRDELRSGLCEEHLTPQRIPTCQRFEILCFLFCFPFTHCIRTISVWPSHWFFNFSWFHGH